ERVVRLRGVRREDDGGEHREGLQEVAERPKGRPAKPRSGGIFSSLGLAEHRNRAAGSRRV
ncbi:MAG: hypothetical protein AVDCRST_MAG78-3351, partial [uncultured Rubrobacteraceae bacterium]